MATIIWQNTAKQQLIENITYALVEFASRVSFVFKGEAIQILSCNATPFQTHILLRR